MANESRRADEDHPLYEGAGDAPPVVEGRLWWRVIAFVILFLIAAYLEGGEKP